MRGWPARPSTVAPLVRDAIASGDRVLLVRARGAHSRGPFPIELGTTTGRARRVGWFDAAVARYAVDSNGIDAIVLTKVDVLDELATLRICAG